jgi:hypothetical protein
MSEYWNERALPVLQALRTRDAAYGAASAIKVFKGHGNDLGLDLSAGVIQDTILQLTEAGHVECDETHGIGGGHGMIFVGLRVTGRGLQVLGEWPRFEAMISPATLATLVDALAEYATTDDAEQMHHAAKVIRRIAATGLRSIVFGAGGQLLRHALGLP